MDRLEQQIEIKRRDVEEAKLRVTRLEIELAALIDASKLRPKSKSDSVALPVKGKPLGSVSVPWQEVLAAMVQDGNRGFLSNQVLKIAKTKGLEITLEAVRERLRKYRILGYLKFFPDKGYFVTEKAIDKFELKKK